MGLSLIALGPRAMTEFRAALGNDARPFRVNVAVPQPEREPPALARSARTTVPTERVITVEQINPQERSREKLEKLRRDVAERRAHPR